MTPSHVSSEDLGLDLQRHAMSFLDHRDAVSSQDHVMLSQSSRRDVLSGSSAWLLSLEVLYGGGAEGRPLREAVSLTGGLGC